MKRGVMRSGLALLAASVLIAPGLLGGAAGAQGAAGKIVFESWEATSTSAGSRSRIGIMNSDGSNATDLTDTSITSFDDWNPAFDKTGSKIVFLSDRTGRTDVYSMNADGSSQRRLTRNSSMAITAPNFSPDGTKIVYSAVPINVPNAVWDIYRMNADGSSLTRLTNSIPGTGGALMATYTPDGSRIVFQRTNPSTFATELCSMNPDGSGFAVITSFGAGSTSAAAISPDGTRIVVALDASVVIMNANGSGRTVLVSGSFSGSFAGSPVFNPDGTKISFGASAGDIEEVFTMNADGSGITQVTFGPGVSPPSSAEANVPGGWAPGSVGAASLASLTLNPSTVLPGASSQATVSLTGPAPAGGAVIALTSTASATVPASITIPAGATSAVFTVSAASVTSVTIATITATFGGVSQSAVLTINPAQQGDNVVVTQAQYSISQKQLKVQATSTSSTATLSVYETSSGAFLGTMANDGGGKYELQTTLATAPANVTIKSSLGGSASLNVIAK